MGSDDIANKIQRLIDKDEIHSVLMLYARGVDRCDQELIGNCYHEGAIDDHGDFILNGVDCADVFTSLVARNPHGGMHMIGNCLVEVETETIAFAESYFMAIKDVEMPPEGKRRLRIRAGRYIDRFEKRSGAWKIAERVVVDEWNQINDIQELVAGPDRFRFGIKDQNDLVYRIRHGRVSRFDINDADDIKSRARS